MSNDIRALEPKKLWNHFSDLNAVPRGSKKEDKVVQFMVEFGKKLGLETIVDDVQNVIIKKPATKGMENRKTVVLQSHLDMVHQKNNDTVFNFDTEGIKMLIDGDWVTADGTTLGADNGLGVAAIMAILESKEIEHPAIEALLTIDEETGMTGAQGLQEGYLQGEILLNLDTEEDDEINVGCAGGVDITAKRSYKQKDVASTDNVVVKLVVNGLNGGHSGMDIHRGLGNANKIMNRILHESLAFNISLAQLNGGSLRNAIPRESVAILTVPKDKQTSFESKVKELAEVIKKDYKVKEVDLKITLEIINDEHTKVMETKDYQNLVKTIYAVHNGVYRMSPDIDDLVETSNNIARVTVENGAIEVACLTRSSVESSKIDLANTLSATFELGGFDVTLSGSYPGWQPNPDSPILNVLIDLYGKLFNGEKPRVIACHAGLECGLLGTHYPNMDMISFGPTIHGAHSPDERTNIKSVQKFWKYLLEILKNTPVKA